MLPDVGGLDVLDIGCGEGHNTRLLAERGARVTGVDIAERFIAHARQAERDEPRGISYQVASAVELPFANERFEAATAFMSFMDIPELDRVVAEAYRVLAPGAFLQFSITHPCFDTPHRRNVRDANGRKVAIEVGDYFRRLNGETEHWLFSAAPPEAKAGLPLFSTPRFTRTLGDWLNLLLDAGFAIERVGEPYPSDDIVRAHPRMERARVVADFLHVRVRKPR
jgi:SAM-dependent methyltransferase